MSGGIICVGWLMVFEAAVLRALSVGSCYVSGA